MLSREGVPFTAYNIEEDDRAYDQLIALGMRTVPVTVIDGETIKGFDEPALMRAIQKWRRSS